MVKTVFSTCGSWIFAASKMPEKNAGSFFLFIKKTALVFIKHTHTHTQQFLSFLKQAGCLAHLAGKSSEVLFHWIGFTTVIALNNHRKLYPAHFSYGTCTLHPRIVFTQLWNSQETCFCKSGNWDLLAKELFSPRESWIVQPQTCPKYTLIYFPLH